VHWSKSLQKWKAVSRLLKKDEVEANHESRTVKAARQRTVETRQRIGESKDSITALLATKLFLKIFFFR
jgi:hypothetical protein